MCDEFSVSKTDCHIVRQSVRIIFLILSLPVLALPQIMQVHVFVDVVRHGGLAE